MDVRLLLAGGGDGTGPKFRLKDAERDGQGRR